MSFHAKDRPVGKEITRISSSKKWNFLDLSNLDPEEVIIDFSESRIADMSAIEAVNKVTERYLKVGKKLHLRHLSADCKKLLAHADELVEVNILEDPTYKVVSDELG